MMLRYALLSVRDRKAGFLGAFVAFLCAAALITACGSLLETGLRGTVATERYAATPVIVSADQQVHQTTVKDKGNGKRKVKHKSKPVAERAWLPAGVLTAVRSAPGVGRAVPELTFRARPLTRTPDDRPAYGHAWDSAALTPFTLTAGRAPRTDRELVVDRGLAERAGLRPGSPLTVQSTTTPRTYTVTGIAAAGGAGLRHQSALFFNPAEARRLSARPAGTYTAIGVRPAPGTSPAALEAALATALKGTTAQVSGGADRGPVEFLDAAGARVTLVSMGGSMAGTSLLVAVFVAAGTLALAVRQRHRELALLRAIAASARQVRSLLATEATLVGLAGGVLGALAGLPLAAWLHHRFTAAGVLPPTLKTGTGVFPALAAVAITVLGARAAARISARHITRISPARALSEAALEPRRPALTRTVLGLLCAAAGVVLVVVLSALRTEPAATPVTFLTVIVLAAAVSLLGPLLVRAAAWLLTGPLRLAGPNGRLAAANLRGNATRMASAVTPVALLVGMTCTVLFSQPTLSHAARAQAREGLRAGWVLASGGPGVPGAAAARIRTVEGVTAATEVVTTQVRIGLTKYAAQGVTPAGLERTWDPGVTSGSLRGFGPRSAAVSELAAEQLGLRPGSRLAVHLGDGTPVTVTVAAVYARGLGFGDLTLAHDLVAAHVDNPLSAAVYVAAAPSVTRAGLTAAVAPYPGVSVLTPDALDAVRAARQRAGAEVNLIAMGLVLAFTAISVVNTLAMSTGERIREFAMLRLAGATRRQVLRMLRLEALSVLLMGAVLGTGIAAAVLTAFSVGMTGEAAPAVLPLVYAAVVGAAGLLALTATAVPGRAALRVRAVTVATAKE
ncbi:FtsX-like permease family protein [Streptomyces sp. NPDC093225]|uniref:ABC transporter permease n=1 Tax=Streptomyces sp. NPDC093225 TaxID=3366034 RepID=UPI003822A2B8